MQHTSAPMNCSQTVSDWLSANSHRLEDASVKAQVLRNERKKATPVDSPNEDELVLMLYGRRNSFELFCDRSGMGLANWQDPWLDIVLPCRFAPEEPAVSRFEKGLESVTRYPTRRQWPGLVKKMDIDALESLIDEAFCEPALSLDWWGKADPQQRAECDLEVAAARQHRTMNLFVRETGEAGAIHLVQSPAYEVVAWTDQVKDLSALSEWLQTNIDYLLSPWSVTVEASEAARLSTTSSWWGNGIAPEERPRT